MRCLSIRQPWADLIVRGIKDVENRNWRCHHRGPLLIHASMNVEKITQRHLEAKGYTFGPFSPGCIVGAVRIVDCLPFERKKSDWHEPDCWGFYLVDAVRFPEPIPFTGKLGLFDVPLNAVSYQLYATGFEVKGVAV